MIDRGCLCPIFEDYNGRSAEWSKSSANDLVPSFKENRNPSILKRKTADAEGLETEENEITIQRDLERHVFHETIVLITPSWTFVTETRHLCLKGNPFNALDQIFSHLLVTLLVRDSQSLEKTTKTMIREGLSHRGHLLTVEFVPRWAADSLWEVSL